MTKEEKEVDAILKKWSTPIEGGRSTPLERYKEGMTCLVFIAFCMGCLFGYYVKGAR